MAMKERGYVSAQSNVVWWHDIELVKHVSDFVDANGKPRTMADENETTEPQEPAHSVLTSQPPNILELGCFCK